MLRYDESNLIARLEALSPRARVAFAAACAERLRAYFGYPNSPPTPRVLEGALEALQRAIHKELPDATLQAAVVACEASLDIDDDAVAAVLYACGAQGSESAQAAAWAARRGYEARDRLVSEALDVDFNLERAEQRAWGIQLSRLSCNSKRTTWISLLHLAIKSRQSSQELARQAIPVMPYKNRINPTALRAARYPARSVRRHESRSGTAKE
jgi:hypothetical protein